MQGLTGVASHRALSAGTLLIVGGGLALYQMTSLVLGPGGSRQLDLSLTIPAVDADERAESWIPSGNFTLGTMAAPAPAPLASAPLALTHRTSGTPAGYRAPAPGPAQPVASPAPTAHPHPSAPPVAPIVRVPGPQPGEQKPEDND